MGAALGAQVLGELGKARKEAPGRGGDLEGGAPHTVCRGGGAPYRWLQGTAGRL